MSRRLRRLVETVLVASAPSLARLRPLGPYPGWWYSSTGDTGSRLATFLRMGVWIAFKFGRVQTPITLPWYEGLQVRLYLGNDLSRCLYVGACYEPNEFAFLSEALGRGMTFADVGANDGLYTLFAARRLGPAGTVLAFEPSHREFARLQENVRLNDLANVRSFRAALGDRTGTAALRTAGYGNEGQNTLGQFIYNHVKCAGVEEVKLDRLDDVLSREKLPPPDVIKMDVEGAEFAVLQGACHTITAKRPLLLLELSDVALRQQNSSAAEVLDLLRSLGYIIFTFDAASGRPVRAAADGRLSANIVAAHPGGPGRPICHE